MWYSCLIKSEQGIFRCISLFRCTLNSLYFLPISRPYVVLDHLKLRSSHNSAARTKKFSLNISYPWPICSYHRKFAAARLLAHTDRSAGATFTPKKPTTVAVRATTVATTAATKGIHYQAAGRRLKDSALASQSQLHLSSADPDACVIYKVSLAGQAEA